MPWSAGGDGRGHPFRWVNQLAYQDRAGRCCQRHALECTETTAEKECPYLAGRTPGPVGRPTVEARAPQGGRERWQRENDGFNRPKPSGWHREHVSSTAAEKWTASEVLWHSAWIVVPLLERGRLRRRLAGAWGRPVWKLFGSRKKVAWRLWDGVRCVPWEAVGLAACQAGKFRLGWDSA